MAIIFRQLLEKSFCWQKTIFCPDGSFLWKKTFPTSVKNLPTLLAQFAELSI